MTNALLLVSLLSLPVAALAQQPSFEAAERARISAERNQAESEFAAQEKACYAKFAVNDCIDAARAQRRNVLADLRRQEVALSDAERRRRATDRVREIEAKQAEQAAARKGAADAREQPVPRALPAPAPSPAPAASPPAATRPGPAVAPVEAEQNTRRHQERVQQAQQHKERVQKKAAENTKASRTLPVPP